MSDTHRDVLIVGRQLRQERDYWIERLGGDPTPPVLPAPAALVEPAASEPGRLPIEVGGEVYTRLAKLTGKGPFLIYTTLFSALRICLGRYGGVSRVVIGSPARKADDGSSEPNALPVVGVVADEKPFQQLLMETRQELLDAYSRQRYPFARLLTDLGLGEEKGPGCPLFEVTLALKEIHHEMPAVGQGLDLRFRLAAERLEGEATYDGTRLEPSAVARLVDHLLAVMSAALEDPAAAVGSLEMLTPEEYEHLRAWGTAAPSEPFAQRRVHHLVEAQAARRPEAPAVLSGEQRLSFGELNRRANRLARRLRERGVGPESLVVLLMDSTPRAMVTILAVLKAGGAYVPLDPRHPRDRLEALLRRTRPALVATVQSVATELPESPAPVLWVDLEESRCAELDESDLDDSGNDLELAYVIYTSGSTGLPNGVMIPHRNLVSRLGMLRQHFGLDSSSRQAQFASMTFDMSVEEIFDAWAVGGALVLLTPEQKQSGLALLEECERQGVTKLNMASSAWHNMVDAAEAEGRGLPPSLKVTIAGGESPSLEKLKVWDQLSRHRQRFFNIYGPTEGTIMATGFGVEVGAGEAQGLERLPIGRPLPDTRVHLLDAWMRPVPVGVPAEIYIGGVPVARGYLDRPRVTARKMVPDPWSPEPGTRLYKTGDLGRWTKDGQIEFMGRVDFQVKVRGFRIELGEIEIALAQHPAVRQNVVLVHEDIPGDRSLTAYVVAASGEAPLDPEDLARHLGERLPDYMVPAAFVELEEMPLTPNGKVDRRVLPAPERGGHGAEIYVAPRGEIEVGLAEIWAEVLHLERVGVDDNFFRLGGHSLLVTRLVSRINRRFEIELPLQRVLEAPTVAGLARQVESERRSGQTAAPPVLPVDHDRPLPLSFAQRRMWFIDQLEPGNPFYNVPTAVGLTGPLDVEALAKALGEIVARHAVLRTTFGLAAGQPVQHIFPGKGLPIERVDLSDEPKEAREAQARQVVQAAARRPFDLAQGPLVRALLVRLAPDDHLFLVTAHHIVCDAWSIQVFIQELAELYAAAGEGRSSRLPELRVQYADFAVWQQGWLQGEVLQRQLAFWRQQLDGARFELDLPLDRPRPAAPSFAGANLARPLSPELSQRLAGFSQDHQLTLFMPLLATFGILLSKYSGQLDLVVGSPIANRGRTEIEPLIGFFLNTLVLRLDLRGDPTYGELLDRVRRDTLAAYTHQDLPLEKLVEELRPDRQGAHTPLFQVLFVLQNVPVGELELAGCTLRPVEIDLGTSQFDLSLALTEGEDGLLASLEYSRELFDDTTVERILGHYERLLADLVENPDRPLSQAAILGPAEREQLLGWAAIEPVPRLEADRAGGEEPRTLHGLLAARAARDPDALAVVDGDLRWTYRELEARALGLAAELTRHGVGPERTVAVVLERSADTVAALWGVLAAGGTYVPLEPTLPAERLAFVLEDAGVSLVITRRSLATILAASSRELLFVDAEQAAAADGFRPASVPEESLAYVIYTSGSTGRPKGVGIPHRAAVGFTLGSIADYELGPGDRMLQFFSFSFDASVEEVFPALASGAALVLRPEDALDSPARFLAVCAQHGITAISLPTSYWHQLVKAMAEESLGVPESLRWVVIGGEQALVPGWRSWSRVAPAEGSGGPRLINTYGPTEATVVATRIDLPPAPGGVCAPPPIGRAVSGTRVVVLDRALRPVPVGVPGELCIGGGALARGYLGRPALTAAVFVPDPYGTEPGARSYRSGDRARLLPSGDLEFLGRIDQQVKVRGFRIELEEIEAVLASFPSLDQATVLATGEGDARRLVAYLVTRDGAPPDLVALREHLLAALPEYMLPAVYVALPELPHTAGGKIDRRALVAAGGETLELESDDSPPETDTEKALAAVWSDLLGRDTVGRGDHFFHLGGHSLLATQLVARLRQDLDVELPLRTVFEKPTLAALAARVEQARARAAGLPAPAPLTRRTSEGDLPLSFAQQRLWFLDQMDPGNPFYNMPAAVRLRGQLDMEALGAAVDEIQRRHEVLRTTFPWEDGGPVQRIGPASGVPLEVIDCTDLPAEGRERETQRRAEALGREGFDLASGPLVRAHLLRLAPEDHVLSLTLHHIVSDGWSMGVLTQELGLLYDTFARGEASPLPELPVQYADFALWQRGWLEGEVLERQVSFWRDHLEGAPELLDLPTDRPRPETQSFRGRSERFSWPEELAAELRRLGREERCTLFMTLLAAFQVLLYRESDQLDFCIGTPVANRTVAGTEPLVGFFVNTLVLRSDLAGRPSFRQLLGRVRESSLDAYAHQDVPLATVVEALRPERSTSYSPLFQVLFNLDNAPGGELQLPALTLGLVETELGTSKRDLSLTVSDTGEGLSGGFTYSTDLFDGERIRRMVARFEVLLRDLVARPDVPVDELAWLTQEDRHLCLDKTRSARRISSCEDPPSRCLLPTARLPSQDRPMLRALIFSFLALFRARADLVLENLVLRQQLAVLTQKTPRPQLSAGFRLFWVALRRIWPKWSQALVLVRPETVVRWHRQGFRAFWRWLSSRRAPGRPRIGAELRELIRRIVAENPTWGAPRVHGELLLLGFVVSERTISRYLRGRPVRPDAVESWKRFLELHRKALVGMDFFTVPTITFQVLYVLVLVAHHRRRILYWAVTQAPNAEWIRQQLRQAFPYDTAPRYLILDRDSLFGSSILGFLGDLGTTPKRIGYRQPWQNGVCERWIGSVRRELLDHVVVFHETHLMQLLGEYVSYYHEDRSHLSLAKKTPSGREVQHRPSAGAEIVSLPRIGGLHHRYLWQAAA